MRRLTLDSPEVSFGAFSSNALAELLQRGGRFTTTPVMQPKGLESTIWIATLVVIRVMQRIDQLSG